MFKACIEIELTKKSSISKLIVSMGHSKFQPGLIWIAAATCSLSNYSPVVLCNGGS